MAEAIISAIVGEMVSRAISLLTSRFSDQSSTEAKLRKICHMVIKIHSVVEEAQGRQITNRGTLEWLSELIDGMYRGRYLLDTIRYSEHEVEDGHEHEHGDRLVTQPFSLSLFNPAKRVRVAACTIKSLQRRQDVGAGEMIDMVLESLQGLSGDLSEFIMLLQSSQRIHRPMATNIFIDGQMFCRHVEKESIINFLLHDDDGAGRRRGELGVLPIVGDIGVGKTTLVQHVCDDDRVRGRFPIIMLFNFACTYARAMGEAAVVLRSKYVLGEGESLTHPLHVLKEKFRGKRFLLVFEDVDTRKKQMLEEELLPCLNRGNKPGSKIIVTTNNRRVARSIGTVQPIGLKVLPHEQYWFFFRAHAFAGADVEENPRLAAAGKAIARKLNGSFFGAKIIGELLRSHPNDPQFWGKILRSNIGGLSLLGDGLSYIADLAEKLLPSGLEMWRVTVCWDRVSTKRGLATLQDLSLTTPNKETCLADSNHFVNVLLCKSVLPFNCLNYIAHCTLRGGITDYVDPCGVSTQHEGK